MDKEPLKLPKDVTVPFRHYSITDDRKKMDKEAINKLLYFALVFGLGFWIGVSLTLWVTLVILGVR